MHTSDNDAPSNPLDSLYCATTEVVRSVTTLSRHSHDPIQSDYGLQLKNDVMKIAEDVEKLYLEVDSVGKGLSNISHEKVSLHKIILQNEMNEILLNVLSYKLNFDDFRSLLHIK